MQQSDSAGKPCGDEELLVQLDGNRRFLFVSQSYCDLFGKTPAELIGHEFTPLVHPDDLPATLRAMESLRRPPHVCQVEQRALTRFGWRWLRWHDWAQVDAQGTPTMVFGLGRDLTRERERAHRDAEDRFRQLFAGSSDPILLLEDGRWSDCNPAALQWLGLADVAQLRGRTPADYSPPLQTDGRDSISAARDYIERAHRDRSCQFEWRHCKANGDYLDVEVVLTAIEVGGRTLLHATWRDLGARRAHEQALRDSERRYRLLFEHLEAGLVLHEIIRDEAGKPCDYRYLELNPAYEHIVGLKATETLGRCVREVLPGVEDKWIELFGAVATTRVATQVEDYAAALGRWFKVVAYSPEPEQFAVIVEDITRRKQAEEDLEEHRRHLANLLANLPGMAYRCLDDGASPPLFVSEGCLDLTGLRQDELLTCTPVRYPDLIHPEDRERVQQTMAAACAAGQPFICEYRILRRDGQERWVWDKGRLVGCDTEGRGIIEGFVLDVTERHRAEAESLRLQQQIQQTQKLESLGVLAGGIAHDFNNILMAVMGHAELARAKVSPLSPACDHLREIEGASRRAAELCRQMLAYAGKSTFALERIDLVELIDEMLHLLKTTISKKAILNLHCERGLPGIIGDPSQIRQIVLNLIMNASEAIGDRSGVISIRVGATRCDAGYLADTELATELNAGLYLHLEVSDTGCGMEPEVRSRIFEPFYTTKFAGRGLGLAAVLGIVRAHNGALKVYSEPGKGSTFKLLLPAESMHPESEARGVGESSRPWTGQGRVLIADDEESLRALAGEMFESMGFEVLTVEDGQQAVDCYRREGGRIDLVMLDLTMPHLDGAEAFAELRRLNPELRVIVASGYTADDVATRFAGKRLAGVLQKPFSLRQLRELVRAIMPEAT